MSAKELIGRADQNISKCRQLAGWSPSYFASHPSQQHIRRVGIRDFLLLGRGQCRVVVLPWDIEEHDRSYFIVRDHNGQAPAFVYSEDEPGPGADKSLT
jgi:hypothetical protein